MSTSPSQRVSFCLSSHLLFVSVTFGLLVFEPKIEQTVAADDSQSNTSALLRELQQQTPKILTEKDLPEPERMVPEDVAVRLKEASQRSTAEWRKIEGRAEWEAFRDARLEKLRASLGEPLPIPKSMPHVVTATIPGDGYHVQNILFESRPGVYVTANLYSPVPARESMPAFLICHSHHNPKTQSELQDMGIMWARHGCVVMVPDQLGHGERRQHPFQTASDYSGEFRAGRQDYYFRYVSGMQLHTIGESLVGWMAWDMQRGIDVLLGIPGVDPKRIAMLGSVAGGGDPTAVAAALDRRVTAVAPFNFGGPQPESRFPLPENAEDQFRYTGSGSWESTRNLRLSAADGFLPWVIVAATAPRRLVYAHEFKWDREHDPVWARLQTIFEWEGCPDYLDFTLGFGSVTGRPPNASHCNNIGRHHRKRIHEAFEKWFGIPVPEDVDQERHDSSTLRAIREDGTSKHGLPLHQLAQQIATDRIEKRRRERAEMSPSERRVALRDDWARLLGISTEKVEPIAVTAERRTQHGVSIVQGIVRTERNIQVPYLLMLPSDKKQTGACIVCIAHEGRQGFLEHRSEALAALLDSGIAICLPDLRATGETRLGSERGRRSWSTGVSSSELMLGGTFVGNQLTDLRCVLSMVRAVKGIDAKRLAVWGDSFKASNPTEIDGRVPLDAPEVPASEPASGLLALLCGLFEPELQASLSHGSLSGYAAILGSPFVAMPHDAVIPGVLTTGDIVDVAAALAPRAVWISGVVDGLNRPLSQPQFNAEYALAKQAYSATPGQLQIVENIDTKTLSQWMHANLKPAKSDE